MTWSMGELESQEQWVRGAEGRGVGPGGAGSNDTGKQASRAPGAGTPGAGRLQMMTPSSGRTGTGEKTADTRRPGRWDVVTQSCACAGPGLGHASRLLLRPWPGGGGLSNYHRGPRKRSRGRRKRRGSTSLRLRRRYRRHGAQRALLDHRTPSTARDLRGWGLGGRGA